MNMYLQENGIAQRFIKLNPNGKPFFIPIFKYFNVCPLYAEACGDQALVTKMQEWMDDDSKRDLVG